MSFSAKVAPSLPCVRLVRVAGAGFRGTLMCAAVSHCRCADEVREGEEGYRLDSGYDLYQFDRSETYSIEWFRNGVQMELPSADGRVSAAGNTLSINHASVADEGTYSCEVSGTLGSTVSTKTEGWRIDWFENGSTISSFPNLVSPGTLAINTHSYAVGKIQSWGYFEPPIRMWKDRNRWTTWERDSKLAVMWRATLVVQKPQGGDYAFSLDKWDRNRLFIDGELIEYDSAKNGDIGYMLAFLSGGTHELRVEYYRRQTRDSFLRYTAYGYDGGALRDQVYTWLDGRDVYFEQLSDGLRPAVRAGMRLNVTEHVFPTERLQLEVGSADASGFTVQVARDGKYAAVFSDIHAWFRYESWEQRCGATPRRAAPTMVRRRVSSRKLSRAATGPVRMCGT